MSSTVAAVVDLVLPARCVGCGERGAPLCPRCLPPPDALRTRQVPAGPLVYAAGSYDGGLRQAVLAWKERGHVALRRPLAVLLARAVVAALAHGQGPVLLVPVPSSRGSRRARGGDLLAGLTVRAGARTGLRTARGTLAVDPHVRDSAGLDRRERQANLRGAFRARPPARLAGTPVLLVDDVLTTGTTLREAAGALRAAGWPVLGAAVVAETPLRA